MPATQKLRRQHGTDSPPAFRDSMVCPLLGFRLPETSLGGLGGVGMSSQVLRRTRQQDPEFKSNLECKVDSRIVWAI